MPDPSLPDDSFFMATAPTGMAVDRLRGIVTRLRGPGGCPWDREQNHRSLVPHLLEEAYEVAEAIHSGDSVHLAEELGDLLLQVVLHSQIAAESGDFDCETVANGICDKLVRRHPHVFGDSTVKDTEGVLRQWDEIKATEKGESFRAKGWLEGIGRGFPALLRAGKLSKKAAKAGFDWPDVAGVLEKLREEIVEVEEVIAEGSGIERLAGEIGDVLFSAANLARKAGFEPEMLLALANDKFERRFGAMEQLLAKEGHALPEVALETMEQAWQEAKRSHG